MKAAIAAAGLLFLVGCGAPKNDISPSASAAAKTPKITEMIVTDDDSVKTPKATFEVSTPKIFIICPIENVPVGSKFKAVWIADKVAGVEPNYKISEYNLDVPPIVNEISASMTTPNKGWPVGTYHVDLTIDGKPMGTAKFSVG